MRKFVKISRRVLAAVLAASMCFSLQAFATESEIKQQQKETQKQLDAINQEMKSIESQRDSILAEIDSLNSDLVDVVLNMELLDADLAAKEEELNQAQADYDAAKQKEEEQYEAMKLRIQYIYEEGDMDYLTLFLEADSFADFLNRADFAREIQTKDRQMLEEYQATKAEVEELMDQLEQEKTDMEALEAEYEEQKASMEATLAQKQAEEADYETQLANAQAQASSYKKKLQEQQSQLKKLEAERLAKEKAAAAQETASVSTGSSSSGSSSGSSGSSSSGSSSSGSSVSVSGGSSTGSAIASYALQFVGNPYVSGGTSLTNGADCSGFTQSVFKHFGISIPRTSDAQGRAGREVSYSEAQAGDIIYYGGHVAIYLGGGRIVHASTAKTGIKTGTATYRTILSVRRYY